MTITSSVEITTDGDLRIYEMQVPTSNEIREWIEFERAQQQMVPGRTWDDGVRDIIRLGAMTIVRAHAAVALDFVKQQATEVTTKIEECFKEFKTATSGLFVDPSDPEALGPVGHQFKSRVDDLLGPVQTAVDDAAKRILQHIDPNEVGEDGKPKGLAAFKADVESAQGAIAQALLGLSPETSPALKQWLDDLDPQAEQGKASRLLAEMENLTNSVRQTASRLFGSRDPNTGRAVQGELETVLARYLRLDDADPLTPLNQIREDIKQEIKTQFAGLTAAQAKSGLLPEHGPQVPKDGIAHEAVVLDVLKEFVGQQGDVEEVGGVPGHLEGKTKHGDFVVVLDDGHTRICVEAKSGSRPTGSPIEYLKDCATNRNCQFTIFAAKDAETLDTWFNNPAWVWHPDDNCIATTRENLQVALHAAKVLLVTSHEERDGDLDPSAIQAEAQSLTSALASLNSIFSTSHTIMNSAKTNTQKIQREARRMAEQVIGSINRMRIMVGMEPDSGLSLDLLTLDDEPE